VHTKKNAVLACCAGKIIKIFVFERGENLLQNGILVSFAFRSFVRGSRWKVKIYADEKPNFLKRVFKG